MENHAGGISMVAFVVALAVSMGYYQFIYVPQADAKPQLPKEILEPPDVTPIAIAEGSSLEANPEFFVPKDGQGVRGVLGISNRVVWTNEDTVAHTVTSDDGYVDKINGAFDSLKQKERLKGGYLLEGQTFDFTFTRAGEYRYHCEPHPHMQGLIEIVENFA